MIPVRLGSGPPPARRDAGRFADFCHRVRSEAAEAASQILIRRVLKAAFPPAEPTTDGTRASLKAPRRRQRV
jgi:hypothetical protein